MDIHLKANLYDAIAHWGEKNVDMKEWPDAYFGGDTFYLMADAAATVFDAVVEFQEYAAKERLFD